MEKERIQIEVLAEGFIGDVLDLMQATVKEYSGNVLLSENSIVSQMLISRTKKRVDQLNTLINDLAIHLPGIKIYKDLALFLTQVLQKKYTEDKTRFEFKRLYIEHNKISIPNFSKVKVESLIDMYDFPESYIEFVERIIPNSSEYNGNLIKYFDEKASAIVFTKMHEEQILEDQRKYLSEAEIENVLCFEILCAVSNKLKAIDFSSSYKINTQLRDLFTKSTYDHKVSVNYDQVKGQLGKYLLELR